MGRFYFRIGLIFLNLIVCVTTTIPVFAVESNKKNSDNQISVQYSHSMLERIINDEARSQGVNPAFVLIIAQIESGLNIRAISSDGAIGVMQLMPETAAELGVENPYDPEQNIKGGVRYLKQLENEFKHPLLIAAAYHSGPQAVRDTKGIPKGPKMAAYIVKLLNEFYQIYDAKTATTNMIKANTEKHANLKWEGDFVLNLNQ